MSEYLFRHEKDYSRIKKFTKDLKFKNLLKYKGKR